VVWPVHPRTQNRLESMRLTAKSVAMIPPVSYLDMLLLERRARLILTDSGGVQKEAYFFRVPCVTLRDETEWVETLENRCNVLTGCSRDAVLQAVAAAGDVGPWEAAYGDGHSGRKVLDGLETSKG